VIDFFSRLPHYDKQIVSIEGMAHNTQLDINRGRFWHALKSFLGMPARAD